MLLNCPRVVHPHPQQHAAQDRHPLAGNFCTVKFCATRRLSHLTFSFKSLSLKEHWSRKRLDTTQPKQTMNILFQSQMISLETALPLPRTLQLTQILGLRSTPPLSKVWLFYCFFSFYWNVHSHRISAPAAPGEVEGRDAAAAAVRQEAARQEGLQARGLGVVSNKKTSNLQPVLF